MGRYINPPGDYPMGAKGKREYLHSIGAKSITLDEAREKVNTHGIIVWVDNGMFEAAGYAYDRDELDCFTGPLDRRPKELFVMDRATVEAIAR